MIESKRVARMMGRGSTTGKPGRPKTGEARAKLIAKLDPELLDWVTRYLFERQRAGDRVAVGDDGKTRRLDMGDVLAEALALLRAKRK